MRIDAAVSLIRNRGQLERRFSKHLTARLERTKKTMVHGCARKLLVAGAIVAVLGCASDASKIKALTGTEDPKLCVAAVGPDEAEVTVAAVERRIRRATRRSAKLIACQGPDCLASQAEEQGCDFAILAEVDANPVSFLKRYEGRGGRVKDMKDGLYCNATFERWATQGRAHAAYWSRVQGRIIERASVDAATSHDAIISGRLENAEGSVVSYKCPNVELEADPGEKARVVLPGQLGDKLGIAVLMKIPKPE